MDENLRKKLVEDIEKTGFGAEMRAVKAFEEASWRTTAVYRWVMYADQTLTDRSATLDPLGVSSLQGTVDDA